MVAQRVPDAPGRVRASWKIPAAVPRRSTDGLCETIPLGSRHFHDFGGLRPFLSLHNFEFHRVAFLQAAIAFTGDGGVVHKNIRSAFASDESKSFGIVEPLHLARDFQGWVPPPKFRLGCLLSRSTRVRALRVARKVFTVGECNKPAFSVNPEAACASQQTSRDRDWNYQHAGLQWPSNPSPLT